MVEVRAGPVLQHRVGSLDPLPRWLTNQIEARGRRINSRPIRSLSDIVDRAILAAYDCNGDFGALEAREDSELIVSLIEGLIALSGLSVAECSVDI